MVSPKRFSPKKPKPKPKPKIEYPPVPTKKWIPPDKRKKPPRPKPAYTKPEGITQKLDISSLEKVWHNFSIKGDVAILTGNFSQTHKRFRPKSNGYQSASNCVVACAFQRIYNISQWGRSMPDKILEMGDELYLKSLMHNPNKCKLVMDVDDIFPSFFLKDTRITMTMGVKKTRGKLSVDADQLALLRKGIEEFFKDRNNVSGVLRIKDRWFAIWRHDTSLFVFEPNDHNLDGTVFKGIAGNGVSVVLKLKSMKKLAEYILEHIDKTTSSTFAITSCGVLRVVKIDTRPPEQLPVMSEEEKKALEEKQEKLRRILEAKKSKQAMAEPLPPPQPAMSAHVIEEISEVSPELPETASTSKRPSFLKDVPLKRKDISKTRIPAEKPRKESLVFYVDVGKAKEVEKAKPVKRCDEVKELAVAEFTPKNCSILRASTHHNDPMFSKLCNQTSIPMAVAALAMLRMIKARHWIKEVMDEILKLGGFICRDTLNEIGKTTEIKVTNLTNKIVIDKKTFTADIEEMSVFGKLETRDHTILNLLDALANFLIDYDCCIILGPLILAVWVENGQYYMFDPNERDGLGRKIIMRKIVEVEKEPEPPVEEVVRKPKAKKSDDEDDEGSDTFGSDEDNDDDDDDMDSEDLARKKKAAKKAAEKKEVEKPPEEIVKTEDEGPKGVACVTWFKDLRDLVDLYMNNLEKHQKKDNFLLCRVKINDYVDIPEAWYNFKALSNSKWILQGTFSQDNPRFKTSRNTQCTANAAMALAFAKIKEEKDWNSETVDQVLIAGDQFYNTCVRNLKESGRFQDPLLMIDEVDRKFPLHDKEVNLQVDDCLVNGLVAAKESDLEVLNLRKGFEEFFKDNETGVVTSHGISVAVWKKDEVFYYFDSHNRDDKGIVTSRGTSCILRMLDIPELTKSVMTNLGPNRQTLYNISRVIVNLLEITEEGIIKPPINNYKELEGYRAILRSTLHERSEKYNINKGDQTVTMCLVALGFNRFIPAAEWSFENMDKILDLGNDYYIEAMSELLEEGYFEKKREELMVGGMGGIGNEVEATKEAAKGATDPAAAVESIANEFEEEMEVPEIVRSDNVRRKFMIGINSVEFEFENVGEGTIEPNLAEALKGYYGIEDIPDEEEPVEEVVEEETEVKEDENKKEGEENADDTIGLNNAIVEEAVEEAIKPPKPPKIPECKTKPYESELLLETDTLILSIWKDDNVFYLFDPRPRDEKGQVYDKDEWSAKVEPVEEVEEAKEEGKEEKDKEKTDEGEFKNDEDYNEEKGAGDNKMGAAKSVDKANKDKEKGSGEPPDKKDNEGKADGNEEQNEEETEEGQEQPVEVKPKMGEAYWKSLEDREGRACTMWFLSFFDLVNHIIDNTPPNKREEMNFKLNAVKIVNKPETKEIHKPDEPMVDAYAGDWYEFKEVEHGRWILRGKKNMDDELFPEMNRNKQAIPCCLTSIAYSHLYALQKFKNTTVDDILKYGDRLYSSMIRERKKILKENQDLALQDDEIDAIMACERFELKDYFKKFCISEHQVEVNIEEEFMMGHTMAKDTDELLNVKMGLEKFFADSKYGILVCKDVYAVVWKGSKMYYMYDPYPRGPNGVASPTGVPCITRYLDLDKLVKTYLKNLPKEGFNTYVIHRVTIKSCPCARQRHPAAKEEKKEQPEITGFKGIIPGKCIIQGTINQEHFNRGPNITSAPIAFIALSMSLIHKPQTWSKPIVDEVITLGDNLYMESIDYLGFDFNPWEDKLSTNKVKPDFIIGIMKANCQLRHADQTGIIDVKASKTTQNLRQGIEKFFEENTHGILQTVPLTAAIWEENDGKNGTEPVIYLFDPNPRGPTGLPMPNGPACLLSFANAKLASDHIISCITDANERLGVFSIVPVEIVVGQMKAGCRKKKRVAKRPLGAKTQLETLRKTGCDCGPDKSKASVIVKTQMSIRTPLAESTRLPEASVRKAIIEMKTETHPSVPKLPRCDTAKKLEEKRMMRAIAERERRVKAAKELFALGRKEFYYMESGVAILRGLHSQTSEKFSPKSRGHQPVPNCMVAYVMQKFVNIEKWTHKQIDLVLEIGEQLYKDSYIMFKPETASLSLDNIAREFYMQNIKIEVGLFMPVHFTTEPPGYIEILPILINYFDKQRACIVIHGLKAVLIFTKEGSYYLFDPTDRDHLGNKVNKGSAIVLRFDSLDEMCDWIPKMFDLDEEQHTDEESEGCDFYLVQIILKKIVRMQADA